MARPRGAGEDAERHSEVTGELPAFVADQLVEPVRPVDADPALVAALTDQGLSEHEARRAVLDDRVALALAAQMLGEQPRYTLDDLADASGVGVEDLRRIRAASGLPLSERYGEEDRRWAADLGRLLATVPVDALVRGARARGAAIAAIARADLGLIRDELVLPMREAGADDLAVAVALAETVRELEPVSRALLESHYRIQVASELDSELSATFARSTAHEVDLAVGFVDLVGYTDLSARIDPEGLDDVLDAFEQRVVEVVAGGDVAIVKYLGDAVMLVGPDAPTLVDVMLELATEVESLADAPLRAGLAAGPTRVREGDYFGSPVNLAARLTDLARPWSVLADGELADAFADDVEVKRIRPTRIRGFGLQRPIAVRRAQP